MGENMKKITGFLVISILVLIFITGCSKTKDSDELVVGMELAYPPFETTDEKGEPTGISVDLAYALGEYLGRTVRIENMAFSGLLPALTTEKIDIIISSMTITEERLEAVDFSDPYSNSYLAILANKETNIKGMEDLNKAEFTVAVKKGTTGHLYAEKNLTNAKINVFEKETACVLEVTQGKADAFIYDQMTILKNWQNNKDKTNAFLKPFQDDPEKWGIAIRKNEPELKTEINTFIKEYKENGGFEALAEKYLKEQKDIFDQLNIPFFF